MYKTYLHEVNQINPVKFLLILNKFKKKKNSYNLFKVEFVYYFVWPFFCFVFFHFSVSAYFHLLSYLIPAEFLNVQEYSHEFWNG